MSCVCLVLLVNRLEHTHVLGVISGSLDKISELAAATFDGGPPMDQIERMIWLNWGLEAVSDEIDTKTVLREICPFSGMKHASSRGSLQVECWFLDNSPPVKYADRKIVTFLGHGDVSREINA